MKKAVIFALCFCMALPLCACSKGESSSSEQPAAEAANEELIKKLDEQQKLIEEQGKKLETVEKVFNTMFGTSDGSIFDEDFDLDEKMNVFNGDVHTIYDDTAVVEAYKSGDSSKLTDAKDKFILEAASKAIKDIIKDGMSDYEKEKAVYDYIFSQAHYDEGNLAAIPHTEENAHTPYGVLHDHTAICVGNATTFKLFMDMLGIDCKIIHSTETGEHAWDLVKIGDGWYHVDITFDGGGNKPSYSQFNVTDEVKERAGYPWNADEFPKAESVEYSFAVQNASEIGSIADTADLFADALEGDAQYCYFKLPLSKSEQKVEGVSVFYDQIISEISFQLGNDDCECTAVMGFVNGGFYYGGLGISRYSDEEGEDNEPVYDFSGLSVDYESIYNAYSDAFGISLELSQR